MTFNDDMLTEEYFDLYSKLKERGELYSVGADLPKAIIKYYFNRRVEFDLTSKDFVEEYIDNETRIEESTHIKEDREGLREMYYFAINPENDSDFNIYTLKDYHRLLFSKNPHPEYAGEFRNQTVVIKGAPINLTPYEFIYSDLLAISPEIDEVYERSKSLHEEKDPNALIDFINDVSVIGAKLIKIHPFRDGNGRTIRCFINKLFISAGLPAVYLLEEEKYNYRKAMEKAIGDEGDFEPIKDFYLYKICDSIIKLKIEPWKEMQKKLKEMQDEKAHTGRKR